jgi:predicted HTH domain antitoxin
MNTAALHKDSDMAGKRFEVELPEEVLAGFGWQDGEVPERMREAVVMELLRRGRISEAEAAAFLDLGRRELLDVMGLYQVPAIQMSHEELQRELHQEIKRG